MRAYEVVVIFDATLEEEAIRPVLDRATAPITKDGAKVTTDRWGKRRFAYELKHRWEGNYVLLAFNTEPAALWPSSTGSSTSPTKSCVTR